MLESTNLGLISRALFTAGDLRSFFSKPLIVEGILIIFLEEFIVRPIFDFLSIEPVLDSWPFEPVDELVANITLAIL